MKLAEGLYLVGGGPIGGFGLTPAADGHIYALRSGDALALIDCGIGTSAGVDALVDNMRADGLQPESIQSVFITHAHADHAGGAAIVRERFGAQIVASPVVATVIETADAEGSSLRAAQAIGIFPAEFRMTPCPVALRVTDGDRVAVGALAVRAITTPGHAAGHTAWLVEMPTQRVLFSGDALFALGRVLLQAVPDCDLAASAVSIRRMATLQVDVLLPGHGSVVLREGHAHVAMAAQALDGLRLPPNLA